MNGAISASSAIECLGNGAISVSSAIECLGNSTKMFQVALSVWKMTQ